MMSGAKHFVATGGMDGVDGAICCEPEGGEICHVAKGALRLRIDLHREMAHGAMPFEGRNPNRAVAAVIAALADLERDVQDAPGDARAPRPAVDHAYGAARRRAGADERHAGRPLDVDRRADGPGHRPRRLLAEVAASVDSRRPVRWVAAAVEVIDDRPAGRARRRGRRLSAALWDAHAAVAARRRASAACRAPPTARC